MKRYGFQILFFVIALTHLVSLQEEWIRIETLTKPLIVLSLLGYYIRSSPIRSVFFVLALIFCCLGDSLLIFQSGNELFFMLGLGAFLIGHIFYIASYRAQGVQSGYETVGMQRIRLAFPIVLAGTGLVVVLLPTLGPLKIPVIVYALTLTFMVVSAIFRLGRTNTTSFWLVFSGAVLFMVSDSLLAINKFMVPLPQASMGIMLTYCSAQFLIVEGMLRR